ncbi:hypothetical protein IKS_02811 [Bacillus cereus VDM062]|nr:hypothetical protein IKS_02811 [Bacillus cereus VDM062]
MAVRGRGFWIYVFFGYNCGKVRREITLLDTLMITILVIILLGVYWIKLLLDFRGDF